MNGKRPNPYGNQGFGGYKRRNNQEEEKQPPRQPFSQMNPQDEKEYRTQKQVIGLMIIGLIQIDFDYNQLRQPIYDIPEVARPLFKAYQDARKRIIQLNSNCKQHMDKAYFYGVQYFEGYINHVVAKKRVPQTQFVRNAAQLDVMIRELENYFQTKEENEELLKDLLPFEELFDKAVEAHNRMKSMSTQEIINDAFYTIKTEQEKKLNEGADNQYLQATKELQDAEDERSKLAYLLEQKEDQEKSAFEEEKKN